MKTCLWAGAMALACLSAGVAAQVAPIVSPSNVTPTVGVTFNAADGKPRIASPSNPLPMAIVPPAAGNPLTGTSTAAQVVGPFAPVLGRPITIALSASPWPGGTVQLLRSTDSGATKLPLTPAGITIGLYSASGADSPWTETESGAVYYLSLPAAGISYRVAQ